MSNGKVILTYLTAGLIKNIQWDCIVRVLKTLVAQQRIKMSKYSPKPFGNFGKILTVKLIFKIMQQKQILAKKNLANLKTAVDKLDINKLVPVPSDLSKLSNVIKNHVVKKTEYDKLVAKVNAIDTSDFYSKTKYDTDKSKLKNKIPDNQKLGLVKKTNYDAKIANIESKTPDVSNLATKTALTTIENKIPSVRG